jgi:hypothetical protein
LTSLEGLRSLENVTTNPNFDYDFMALEKLPAVHDLTGLRNLKTVAGDLHWVDLAVTDFRGLENLSSVGRFMVIHHNPNLVHLTGLDHLQTVDGEIEVKFNPSLVSIGSLNALRSVSGGHMSTGILIENNGALQRVDGFRRIVALSPSTGIGVHYEPALVAIDGFDSVESVGSISIFNSKLPTLKAFGALTLVYGDVRVDVSGVQSTMNAFGSLARVDGDLMLQGRGLTSLSELGALASVGGSLQLSSLGVTTLGELRSLRSIGGSLDVQYCQNLVHVNVLPSLTSVGALNVLENAALPQCDADALLTKLKDLGFQGPSKLMNNGGTAPCN